MHRITFTVISEDPLVAAGIREQLRLSGLVKSAHGEDEASADVTIVAADSPCELTLKAIRKLHDAGTPVVLVVGHADDDALMAAVEVGVSGVLRRIDASPSRLASSVEAAHRGDASFPPELLGRILKHVQHRADGSLPVFASQSSTSLDDRETSVLQLVADGLGTREIATRLAYSERTIKSILQDITHRFGLRNRSHAVAYAMRQGMI